MPMITCTDCGKSMSNAAPACPSCGKPNKSVTGAERPVSTLLGIGILFLPLIFAWFTLRKGHTTKAKTIAFIWLAAALAFYSSPKGGRSSYVSTPSSGLASEDQATRSKPVMQVGIEQILSDYKNNEVGADNKYKGNRVQVVGFVSDIKKDILNNLYVTIGTRQEFEIPKVQAFFDDSMNNQLSSLNKNQQLTVVCRIEGLMMNVLAKDCIIK